MFWGSAYLFAIIKYFSFAFFRLVLLQRNFLPLRLRHKSSAIYGAPPFTGHQIFTANSEKIMLDLAADQVKWQH